MAGLRQLKRSRKRHRTFEVVQSQLTKRQVRQLIQKMVRQHLVIPRSQRQYGPLYVLDGHKPIRAANNRIWAIRLEKRDRTVCLTRVGDKRVSTVFLGLDHSFRGPPPQLFETMVFGPDHLSYDWPLYRYPTWRQAWAGHQMVVADVIKATAFVNDLTTPPPETEQ